MLFSLLVLDWIWGPSQTLHPQKKKTKIDLSIKHMNCGLNILITYSNTILNINGINLFLRHFQKKREEYWTILTKYIYECNNKALQNFIFFKKKKKNPWKKVVELSVYKYRLVGNTTNILMKGGIPNKQMKENLKIEFPYHNCCIFLYLFLVI